MNRIYILESDGFYKIGVSANINNWIKELQTGNPYTIECVFSRRVPEAYEVEKYIHKLFEQDKVSGEWFEFDDRTLEYIKDIITFNMRLCTIPIEDRDRVERHQWDWCQYQTN